MSLVGDKLKDALEVKSLCFESGSNHFTGLAYLTKLIVKNNNMTIPEAVQYVKKTLLKSIKDDSQTSGALKIYSFTNHRHEQNGFVMKQKYLKHVMDELEQGNNFARKIFDLKTMFVILEVIYSDIMAPNDLFNCIKKFGDISYIGWLGYVGFNKRINVYCIK